MAEQLNLPESPGEPLFRLDLGANGGLLAPRSIGDLRQWIQKEIDFWKWGASQRVGPWRGAFDRVTGELDVAAQNAANAASRTDPAQLEQFRSYVEQARNTLAQVFMHQGLPHSSTPLAKRVAELRESPVAALAYLHARLPVGLTQQFRFDGGTSEAWRGFILGVLELDPNVKVGRAGGRAERAAAEELRVGLQALVEEKTLAAEALHRQFADLVLRLEQQHQANQEAFVAMVAEGQAAIAEVKTGHEERMSAIERNFGERMALKGPVDYWSKKAETHSRKAAKLLGIAQKSMAGLSLCLLGAGIWVASEFKGTLPNAAALAMLGLVAVLGVWALRLVLRMYLSYSHLATDAEERVTMVMTYLALLESSKLPSDDDRKLILTALFRPASDGLVKDEGLPHPVLEMLTKSGGK